MIQTPVHPPHVATAVSTREISLIFCVKYETTLVKTWSEGELRHLDRVKNKPEACYETFHKSNNVISKWQTLLMCGVFSVGFQWLVVSAGWAD